MVPDGLSEVVASALKKEIVLSFEAEVNGHPRDAAEGKWTLEVNGHPRDAAEGKSTLEGGIEVTEITDIYRFYSPKKSKAEFRNKLSK